MDSVVLVAEVAASMPSGMMMIKEVPTRTPTPMLDRRRSCDDERDMDKGRAPAMNELSSIC